MKFTNPHDALRHHVSGAIERGGAAPIVEMTANIRGSAPANIDDTDYLPERCMTCQRVYTTFTCDHESGISREDEQEAQK